MLMLNLRGGEPEWLLAAYLDIEIEEGVFDGPRPLAIDVLVSDSEGKLYVATLFPKISTEQESQVRRGFAEEAMRPHNTKLLKNISRHPKLSAACGVACTKKTEYVYFIQIDGEGAIKIGVSNNPLSRLETLQTGSHQRMTLLGILPGGYDVESQIHAQFAKSRIRGEWFTASPELIDFIHKTATSQ
jgi:hypothetical protein